MSWLLTRMYLALLVIERCFFCSSSKKYFSRAWNCSRAPTAAGSRDNHLLSTCLRNLCWAKPNSCCTASKSLLLAADCLNYQCRSMTNSDISFANTPRPLANALWQIWRLQVPISTRPWLLPGRAKRASFTILQTVLLTCSPSLSSTRSFSKARPLSWIDDNILSAICWPVVWPIK